MTSALERVAVVVLAVLCAAAPAAAQRHGEYLTDQEQDTVREAQQIDLRATVFIKITDRRLQVLVDPTAKVSGKDEKLYGPLPTGSRIELLDDYRRALDELMEKVDDAFQHKGKSPQFIKAAQLLRDAIARQTKQLTDLRAQLKDPDEIQFCDKALDSAKTLADGISGVLGPDTPVVHKSATALSLRRNRIPRL